MFNRRLATKRYVHRVIDSKLEKKIHEFIEEVSVPNAPGIVYGLTRLEQIISGDNYANERIGNEITITSVQVRGQVNFPVEDTLEIPPFCVVRMVIFQWLEDESSNPPTAGDILWTYDSTPGTLLYSMYSKNSGGQFKILKDKTFTVSPLIPVKTFHYMFTDIHKKIQYHNAYPSSGDIFVALISNVDESDTEPPEFQWVARTTYTDA